MYVIWYAADDIWLFWKKIMTDLTNHSDQHFHHFKLEKANTLLSELLSNFYRMLIKWISFKKIMKKMEFFFLMTSAKNYVILQVFDDFCNLWRHKMACWCNFWQKTEKYFSQLSFFYFMLKFQREILTETLSNDIFVIAMDFR